MSEIKVTVKMPSDQKWVLNVEEDLIIEDLKCLIEVESNI